MSNEVVETLEDQQEFTIRAQRAVVNGRWYATVDGTSLTAEGDTLEACLSVIAVKAASATVDQETCASCGKALERVYKEPKGKNYHRALGVHFVGGYAMFFDEVSSGNRLSTRWICHECAHDFADKNGWSRETLDYGHMEDA